MALYTFEETVKSNLKGTIIDIKTIGEYDKMHKGDSRECASKMVIAFGYLGSQNLTIICAKDADGLKDIKIPIPAVLGSLERPFYAFNCSFESYVLYHQIGIKIIFDGDIQPHKWDRKEASIKLLKIPNYGDPFYDDGSKCKDLWSEGGFLAVVAYHRASLLKERAMLIKQGYRDIDPVVFAD